MDQIPRQSASGQRMRRRLIISNARAQQVQKQQQAQQRNQSPQCIVIPNQSDRIPVMDSKLQGNPESRTQLPVRYLLERFHILPPSKFLFHRTEFLYNNNCIERNFAEDIPLLFVDSKDVET